MSAIRHKSVKVGSVVPLSIEGLHLSDVQEVEVLEKEGNCINVIHRNGFVRVLEAASPDVRTYADPTAPQTVTFRLLEA